MRVLAFGTYDVSSHPRIGVLIEGLRARGHQVDECNVPLGIDTAGRVALLRQPWRLPQLALRLALCWARLAARARRTPRPDAVLVGYLGHFDVLLARALFPRTSIVLDQLVFAADTAADRGVATGLRPRLLRRLDRAACASADLVVVDTEENKALARDADRVVVVPVGAAASWSALPPHPASRPAEPLRVVFFGLFTPLQGCVTIARAAVLLDPSRVRLTLIGRGQEWEAARTAAGPAPVTWVDWVAAADLPAEVAAYDVCLGIFGTTPKALRVVPNKIYQGAAAGCALVTSDTPPQRRVLGSAARFVPPGEPGALAAALLELADDRASAVGLAAAARTLADTAFTPAAVTAALEKAMSDPRPAR